MALIACQDAAFGYEGKAAVSALCFEVRPGDCLCVVGENGSGKSTLIKGLLRLLPPLEGTLVMGEGLKPTEIGYLPQQTAVQKDFPSSAFEVVLSGRLAARGIRPFYSRADKAIVRRVFRSLGIETLQNRCYRELSGGQQQRVLVARALAASGRLLLLDEPTAGLDPTATQELYRLLTEQNTASGVAVIMVSHDVRNAVRHASHILHLHTRQTFFGTTDEYVSSPVGRAFVDSLAPQPSEGSHA
ncbi:MAG: metal ABC transporter ATP-binding protein [Coriobacteriales bacterium]|jgi:zinc transport system ATP-binding protein|nr:metal ABC transporter ATP-binding protein [Coriobacteriales bacterium]